MIRLPLISPTLEINGVLKKKSHLAEKDPARQNHLVSPTIRALTKKSIFENIEDSILLNPFKKLAGLKAFFLGLPLIIVLSVLG